MDPAAKTPRLTDSWSGPRGSSALHRAQRTRRGHHCLTQPGPGQRRPGGLPVHEEIRATGPAWLADGVRTPGATSSRPRFGKGSFDPYAQLLTAAELWPERNGKPVLLDPAEWSKCKIAAQG